MKKTSKSTGSAGPRKTRHTKSTKAPVTIDLKAEKVKSTSKPAEDSKPDASKRKTDLPEQKLAPKTEAKKKSPKQPEPERASAAANDRIRSTERPGTNFGRNPARATEQTGSAGQTSPRRPTEAETVPASTKPSGGWFGPLVAGIVGGIIVLGGYSFLQSPGQSPGQSPSGDYVSAETLTTAQTELNNKIAALEAELKKSQSAGAGEIDLSSINADIDTKLKDASTTTNSQITQVSDQVTKTSEKLAQLEEQFRTVKDSLVTLEASGTGEVNSATSPLLTKRFDEITEKIDATNSRLEELKSSNETQVEDAKIVTALTAIAALETALPKIENDLKAGFSSQFKSTTDKIAAIEMAQAEIPELANNLAELGETLTALKQQNNEQQQTIAALQEETSVIAKKENHAAGSIAAAALKDDVDSGQPFTASLQILEGLTGKTEEIAGLSEFAEKGVPTLESLHDQFGSMSDKILTATKPKQEGDLSDRLLNGLRSIVKTTPVKPLEGSSPEAVVSQIVAALKSGDSVNASKLWASLPEAGQKISQDWHTSLQARASADRLISKTVQSFLQPSTSQ